MPNSIVSNKFTKVLPAPLFNIGMIIPIAHTTIPDGWLECNGSQVSRTTYIELFNKIGTTYGSGDGLTTFGLPDLRACFIRGLDRGRGVDSNRQLGQEQLDDFKAHNHTFAKTGGAGSAVVFSTPSGYISVMTNDSSMIGNTGGTETRPRNVALIYIIKAKNIAGSDAEVIGANADTVDGLHASDFLLKNQGINFKNYVINGNFQFWQRGTSSTNTTSKYVADRWCCNPSTSGTQIVNRRTFTPGQTEVPNEPAYYLEVNQSVASAATPNIWQAIEGVRTFAGKTVTLSFWMKASSATTTNVMFQQGFGTGGSAMVNSIYPITYDTTWKKYTITATIPSITGKTIGTAGDFLAVTFSIPANTTVTYSIAQVQLEEGTVATSFELRPMQTELALCQRYFEKSYDVDTAPGTIAQNAGEVRAMNNTGGNTSGNIYYKSSKRAAPTMTTYSPTTGASGKQRDYTSNAEVTNISVSSGCTDATYVSSTAGTLNNFIAFHWTADAEF